MKNTGETQLTRLRCLSDQIHLHAKAVINQIIHTQSSESQAMKDTYDHNALSTNWLNMSLWVLIHVQSDQILSGTHSDSHSYVFLDLRLS